MFVLLRTCWQLKPPEDTRCPCTCCPERWSHVSIDTIHRSQWRSKSASYIGAPCFSQVLWWESFQLRMMWTWLQPPHFLRYRTLLFVETCKMSGLLIACFACAFQPSLVEDMTDFKRSLPLFPLTKPHINFMAAKLWPAPWDRRRRQTSSGARNISVCLSVCGWACVCVCVSNRAVLVLLSFKCVLRHLIKRTWCETGEKNHAGSSCHFKNAVSFPSVRRPRDVYRKRKTILIHDQVFWHPFLSLI